MPVYREHRDNIVGILHARDLLAIDLSGLSLDRHPLPSVLRKPYFVPESKSASELFDTFRETNRSLALVVDEYGGVTGLVTMEDLLECIFGEIPSPSDEAEESWVRELADNRFALPGSTPIEDFNARFGANLEIEEIYTLGGLVLHHFGELPAEGQAVDVESFRFMAARVESNRIAEVIVETLAPTGSGRAKQRQSLGRGRSTRRARGPHPIARGDRPDEQPDGYCAHAAGYRRVPVAGGFLLRL